MSDSIHIISFDERYARDFSRLNRDWLEGFGLLENADAKHLDSPYDSIIAPGGQIFFALENACVVGTCAVIRRENRWVEIAKLAVSPAVQRRGIARMLVKAAVKFSRRIGASKIILVSSSKLQSALRLYESMGFVHEPLPEKLDYASADVYMELDLTDSYS
jgi:putative acetyltransferase